MKKVTVFFLSLFLTFSQIKAQNIVAQQKLSKADKSYFIENKGQWHSDVLYLCRMGGLDAWITKYGVNYTFYKIEKDPQMSAEKTSPMSKGKFKHEEFENNILLGHRILLKLQNHKPSPLQEGKQKQTGYYNYFIGNDPSKHASNVGLYKEVIIKDVYNGIDIRYYFDKGSLRYDFVVHPGANPSKIAFTLEGQNDSYLKDGNLFFTTRFGEVAMAELYTYQGKTTVTSHFEKQGNIWKVAVGNYNRTQDLIIDPLIYSTYIGGSSYDIASGIAIDGSGNVYISGETASSNYDTTAGAYQTTIGGNDVFVTKLNSSGSALIYSTYIGGNNSDGGYEIEIDSIGNAYVMGYTFSTDYDTTSGAYQTTNDGNRDLFVTKLNSTGTALVYSTYIGGSNDDYGNYMTIDNNGNAYITGFTNSTDFDTTAGAFQTTYGGNYDLFVTKLNNTGTALMYSTYIGGSNDDEGRGISVDGSGNAYITGTTASNNYDITSGAYQTTYGGNYDLFVTKLNSIGTALVYSTFIGGSNGDYGNSIDVDSSGNAYVTGSTLSANYDTTAGAYQTTYDGNWDVFVTKLNSNGTALMYSTYIGGSYEDGGNDIAIDGSGNTYVIGSTISNDYDITSGAYQTTYGGGLKDVFVTKLNSTGTALLYSTYIGGSVEDYGLDIAVDGSGNVYLTGITTSTDYDITSGAFQTTYGGGLYDSFVTKLDMSVVTSGNIIYQDTKAFSLYPNPNNGTFIIQCDKPAVFELTDITGKLIKTYRSQGNNLQVNDKLPSGMYFIRNKESKEIQKLIIE